MSYLSKIKKLNEELEIENQNLKRRIGDLNGLEEEYEFVVEACRMRCAAKERQFLYYNWQQCEFTGEIAPDYEWKNIFHDGWRSIKDKFFKQISDNKYEYRELTNQQIEDIVDCFDSDLRD